MTTETKIIGLISLVSIALLFGFVWLSSVNAPLPKVEPQKVEKPELIDSQSQRLLPEAPVQLVEFGDFQCPACGATHPVIKQLQAHFGSRLGFVYRHYPLDGIHPHADSTALASQAAANQGKFFEYHDLLFAKQNNWSTATSIKKKLISYAKELNLDLKRFEEDLNSESSRERVALDKGTALALGLTGTPSLFINGERYQGELTFEALKAAIEAIK